MNTLQSYKKFFKLLKRDQDREFEQYAKTALNILFAGDKAFYGTVAGVTGQDNLILKFHTKKTPRLKVPKSFCIVNPKAFDIYGKAIQNWSCSSFQFRENESYHTSFSDVLPIYFYKNRKTIGCGKIQMEVLRAIKTALERGMTLYFIMLENMPPTELLLNLADYIDLHPSDSNLLLKPKIKYDEWKPVQLRSTDNVPHKVRCQLRDKGICVLQGPPGTGKSYALADIISKITAENKSVCVTTQSNASLISLISQDTMQPLIGSSGTISKTVLTTDEKKKHPFLMPANLDLSVAKGSLLCTTYYSLSRIINKYDRPIYDLIVIEEASQAFLTVIAAFMKLGKQCLIVGDPMQLPPVVEIKNESDYEGIDLDTQIYGMETFVCSKDVPSFRMTTSFRLTTASTNQSKYFYDGNFTSVQKKKTLFNVPAEMSPFFPEEGGTIIYNSEGSSSAICSKGALEIIRKIVGVFNAYYPKRRLAILSPFVKTTDYLQAEFCGDDQKLDLLVETINRIQGETVDYTIFYIPLRYYDFAFSDNLFNVATSRSRSTTLLITDMPVDSILIKSVKVKQFLRNCKSVNLDNHVDIDRNEIKLFYPGLEPLVDVLLDNNIEFSFDGDVDLLDHDGIVIATAGLLLDKYKVAIDPVDEDSKQIFERAGYQVISSDEFSIDRLK